jgi:hypothetical protein
LAREDGEHDPTARGGEDHLDGSDLAAGDETGEPADRDRVGETRKEEEERRGEHLRVHPVAEVGRPVVAGAAAREPLARHAVATPNQAACGGCSGPVRNPTEAT